MKNTCIVPQGTVYHYNNMLQIKTNAYLNILKSSAKYVSEQENVLTQTMGKIMTVAAGMPNLK